jgi:hypothetical protein
VTPCGIEPVMPRGKDKDATPGLSRSVSSPPRRHGTYHVLRGLQGCVPSQGHVFEYRRSSDVLCVAYNPFPAMLDPPVGVLLGISTCVFQEM